MAGGKGGFSLVRFVVKEIENGVSFKNDSTRHKLPLAKGRAHCFPSLRMFIASKGYYQTYINSTECIVYCYALYVVYPFQQ